MSCPCCVYVRVIFCPGCVLAAPSKIPWSTIETLLKPPWNFIERLLKYWQAQSKARGVQKGRSGLESVIEYSEQLLLNKFLYLSSPSMRKDRDRERREKTEQAGAELGQAQLKLGLDLTSTNLHWKARNLVLLYLLSRPTFHFTPLQSNLKWLR